MSDIEFVIKKSKMLEAFLETEFSAEGKGLHEKLNSVQVKLPEALVKKLRFIATMRNNLVHNSEIDYLEDRQRFENTCNDAESQLRSLARPAYSNTGSGGPHGWQKIAPFLPHPAYSNTGSGPGCAVIIALFNAIIAATILLWCGVVNC